jgi:glutathione S-transferase
MTPSKPVLWHIPVSHYSEKARWALGHKSVEHERRTPLPGVHMAVAGWLTRGRLATLPMLRLEGETIGDSTAIIAALERRFPEPALYPADADARRRALELEEFFDEQLGPPIRLFVWHEMRTDREGMAELTANMVPAPMRRFGPVRSGASRFGSGFVSLRYGAGDDRRSTLAREQVLTALDRLEAELDAAGGDYLAGDSFSVADLTAAALFYPLVQPPEGPRVLPKRLPPRLADFRAQQMERPGYRWVERIFARHRRPGPSAQPETSTIASTSTGTSNGN